MKNFKSSQIMSSILLLVIVNFNANAIVPVIEREALVALYNSTDGANWANKTNWLIDDPCTNAWFGIVCAEDAVTEINLVDNNLVGTIPSELGDMATMEKLDLGINQLTGTIPPEFVGLTQLKHLYLRENLLSGSFPAFIGSMNSLDNIWMADNLFNGSIPSELENLTNMTWLTLSRNLFTGTIPVELKNMTNLEKLHLQENQLSGTIPPGLSELTNLTQMYLYGNKLEGEIPVSLSMLTNLERMLLGSNSLTGNIPPELASLSNLQHLRLESNQLSGSIPPEIGNLSNLLSLYLDSNQLSGAIPVDLGNITNLERMYLHSNYLTGTIPAELGNILSLDRLRLYSNQLTGEVPVSLTSLSNLTDLNLSYNTLYASDANLINFMNGFCGCDWSQDQTIAPLNLEVVALSSNSISLNWDSVSYQQHGGYNILMSDIISGPFVEVYQTSGKLIDAYTKGDLTPGADYYFQIQTFTNSHINPDPLAPQPNVVTSESSEIVSAITSLTSGSADLFSETSSEDLLGRTNKDLLNRNEIGDLIEYIIVVGNNGPDDAIGSGFRHNIPTGLINVTWTCETNSGNASCTILNGSGNMDVNLDLPVSTSLKFIFDGEIASIDEASLLITSTITPPDGVSDPDLISNESASNFEVIYANGFE